MRFFLSLTLFGLLAFLVTAAIDCPNGLFLSPQGNDTTGEGTLASPFKTYKKCLEHSHQNGIQNVLVCFLQGSYSNEPILDIDYPFESIVLVPADKTATLPLLEDIYFRSNSTNFEMSFFNVNVVSLRGFKTNMLMHLHDIYSDIAGSHIDYYVSDSEVKFERLYGVGINVPNLWGMSGLIVNIDNSRLNKVYTGITDRTSITNSVFQDGVSMNVEFVVEIINCTASGVSFQNLDRPAFISVYHVFYETHNVPIVNFKQNHFINNSFYSAHPMELLSIPFSNYTLNYENNYFSCNKAFGTDTNYPLPLLPKSLSSNVTANIVNNIVDQTCPNPCPDGKVHVYQGLACANCPPYHYIVNDQCVACKKEDNNTMCVSPPSCSFFQEPPDCTQLSTNGKIVIGSVCGGLLLIIGIAAFLGCRNVEYTKIQ